MNYLMQILDIASIIYKYFDVCKLFIHFLGQLKEDTAKRDKIWKIKPILEISSDISINQRILVSLTWNLKCSDLSFSK